MISRVAYRCRQALVCPSKMHVSLENLIRKLGHLPGLGPRSARRAVLFLLKNRERLMLSLSEEMHDVANNVRACIECGNLDITNQCSICRHIAEAGSPEHMAGCERHHRLFVVFPHQAVDLDGSFEANQDIPMLWVCDRHVSSPRFALHRHQRSDLCRPAPQCGGFLRHWIMLAVIT